VIHQQQDRHRRKNLETQGRNMGCHQFRKLILLS